MKYSYLDSQSSLTMGDIHQDEKTLRFLKKQVDIFIKHLKSRYPGESFTNNLISKFSDVQLLPFKKGSTPTSYISGMFDHKTGTLHVASRDGSGNMRDERSLNKSITHELAHGTRNKYFGETSHSDDWKKAWKRFLKIATEELNWEVEAPCSSKQFYGLDTSDCPKCIWEDRDCKAGVKQLA